jgi:hypothetical protein
LGSIKKLPAVSAPINATLAGNSICAFPNHSTPQLVIYQAHRYKRCSLYVRRFALIVLHPLSADRFG